ncbi:MAG TPA: hypothetical protein V6D14_34285 [Coleofasciculaceae cyanobacterium]
MDDRLPPNLAAQQERNHYKISLKSKTNPGSASYPEKVAGDGARKLRLRSDQLRVKP